MMDHDVCHCSDYDPNICPITCYRAQVTQDLRNNLDKLGEDLMSFAHFKNTHYCAIGQEDTV